MKKTKAEKLKENRQKNIEAKKPKNLRKPKAETKKTRKNKKMKHLMGRPMLENREERGVRVNP
jgi:hypothetical protein